MFTPPPPIPTVAFLPSPQFSRDQCLIFYPLLSYETFARLQSERLITLSMIILNRHMQTWPIKKSFRFLISICCYAVELGWDGMSSVLHILRQADTPITDFLGGFCNRGYELNFLKPRYDVLLTFLGTTLLNPNLNNRQILFRSSLPIIPLYLTYPV